MDLSLREAVALALRDNRTIKSAYLQRIAQRFDLVVAQSLFFPKLTIQASVGEARELGERGVSSSITPTGSWLLPTGAVITFAWSRNETTGVAGTRTQSNSISITQPLLKGAGVDVNLAPLRVAEYQEQINHLQLKQSVSETVTATINAYRNLQQAQEQVRLAEDAVERARNLLATNRALVDAGRMAAADELQTEADLANQSVAVLQSNQVLNSARLSLLKLLAIDLRSNVIASDSIHPVHVDVDIDRAIALAKSNRMDLIAQEKSVAIAKQNLLVAKNNRLWNLSAFANYQNERFANSSNAIQSIGPNGVLSTATAGSSGSVGLQLSVPIGDLSIRQAYISAETSERTARLNLEELEQQVEASTRDATQSVEMAWLQYKSSLRAEDLSKRTLDNERAKLSAGRASNFEVLSFETSLRSAEAQSLAAGIGYLNALTTLDQQLGTTLDTWHISLND